MKVYLEYRDDKSEKFWSVTVAASEVTIQFGRIGTTGQSKSKDHGTYAKAKAEAEKMVAAKKRKGYVAARRSKTSKTSKKTPKQLP